MPERTAEFPSSVPTSSLPLANAVPPLAVAHLEQVAATYEREPTDPQWGGRRYRQMLAAYYRYIIPAEASVLEVGCGSGYLLSLLPNRDVTGIDLSERQLMAARQRVGHGAFYQQAGEHLQLSRTFDYIIISDTLNLAADVQAIFGQLQSGSHDRTRLIVNFQNQLWRPLLRVAEALGLKRKPAVNNWLTQQDVETLLRLAQWEPVFARTAILCPVPLLGIDRLVNRFLTPVLAGLALTVFLVGRPTHARQLQPRSVSVVIPARNEAGNIESAVLRTPEMGAWTELIFIEGHSRDHTWAEIQRVKALYPEKRIKILQQTGRGKGNAVREAFAQAEGDILMILDADLTMPPEELPKFYAAVAANQLEFANGSRLVYPMEKKAMRFLNMCANKFFGVAFTWLLQQPLKDTLCGTKVLLRSDYLKIAANRHYFGDFDPFGDFDLLFGAAKLGLRIGDVPIRYRDRTYGETNIQRWRHGWLLLRMMAFAAKRIRFLG